MDQQHGEISHPRIKVAIVDDDRSVRRALCRLFSQFNVDSEPFSSGPEFIESLARSTPDWVVLDFWMPQMTGWDVLGRLNKMEVAIRTIVMSGDEELAVRAGKIYGKTMFLRKPIDQGLLLSALAQTSRLLHRTEQSSPS